MRDLVMPKVSLGDDDETMVLLQWLVEPGQEFGEGDPLIEVETAKANMEVEAPFAGVLGATIRQPGDEVVPGDVLAMVADPGEDVDLESMSPTSSSSPFSGAADPPLVEPSEDGTPAAEATHPTPVDHGPAPVETAMADGHAEAAPNLAASIMATEGEGDARSTPVVSGGQTGPGQPTRFGAPGELFGLPPVSRPVRPPASPSKPPRPLSPPADGQDAGVRRPLSRHRQALARLMSRSAEIPQFSVHRDLPMAAAQRAVTELRAEGVPTTLTDVVLRATAEALLIHPEANCHFRDGDVYSHSHPAIALAADSPAGVVAPVIRQPHARSWSELARERRRVVEGARNGRLLPADMTGGTFAISNVGALGGDLVIPMLTPPQVAILGLGRVRPSVGTMIATGVLVADHRALDGGDAARFLATLSELLERASSRDSFGGVR